MCIIVHKNTEGDIYMHNIQRKQIYQTTYKKYEFNGNQHILLDGYISANQDLFILFISILE